MITAEQYLGLDSSHLVSIDEKHALISEVKTVFCSMQDAASAEGIDLQLVSSYRSFSKQCQIWNKKWQGLLPLNTLDGNVLDTSSLDEITKLHAILLWSALPGASRHHWGTDIDVYDRNSVETWQKSTGQKFNLLPSEYEQGGPCARLSDWLQSHMAEYGFFRPYHVYRGGVASEPWHLSYQPLADEIIEGYDLSQLESALAKHRIDGIDVIFDHLQDIFTRYTLNAGR
ncbi:M15 family metallopeptidase [Glaciecola sp. MH2013]|uniref:M15 family metallopeptidase n=1 Tax=Glaciecola sp. MH2013 TaxID=2785524 RepID=UPI00189F749C|nr:M15 family metallopeptidase [Glaciecola sp. MH2013]MBF7072984.1 M15 family metallopeptidase [Glaciecola sp. MH2013]